MALSPALLLELGALGFLAGVLGAIVGIGGGIVLIPTLVLAFGIDIKIAVAASLVAVVATSTAAGSVYVGKGLSNMRLGMTLEIATTLGGISGGILAMLVPSAALAGLFSAMMLLTAYLTLRSKEPRRPAAATPTGGQDLPTGTDGAEGHEEIGKLAGSYYDPIHRSLIHYEATRLPLGVAISLVAGILSGMLGVGGGFIKVPAMNLGMKVPLKVAAATSNFMIGVTAISSLFVYFARGLVHPFIAAPLAIGVVLGALLGTSLSHRTSHGTLKRILAFVLIAVSAQMFLKAIGVSLVGK
jgi:uncharacterized membrane protein YfcA